MPKAFDAASKFLLEADPAFWLALIGLDRNTPVSVLEAELSTVTSEAGKVLRIDGPEPWLVHIEVQAGHDPAMARRLYTL